MQIGAYQPGTDPALDEALVRLPAIEAFLRQSPEEWDSMPSTVERLHEAVARESAFPEMAALSPEVPA